MSATCDPLVQGASDGVAAALSAVDCMAGEATASAFARLFGSQGALLPALTLLLTLYIAIFALGLLTGRARLGVAALTPRMMLIGVVLTFATSWVAYQGVLWNLMVGAPDQVAGVLMGAKGPNTQFSATHLFASRIDVLFQAIADAADMANQQQAQAGTAAPAAASGTFAPASLVWLAAVLLLLGTVGVLVTARIVLAVLLALGPVFIVLGLLRGTRGLCAGWLRALVLVAVTPLLAVLGGGLTIELAVPVVQQLAGPDGIEARPAFALFLVAAVHCALMVLALRTAGTMVAGWRVFGLAREQDTARERTNSRTTERAAPNPAAAASAAAAAAADAARTRATFTPAPAISGAVHAETRRTVLTQMTGTPAPATLPPLRAQGIGSRWRRPASGEILR